MERIVISSYMSEVRGFPPPEKPDEELSKFEKLDRDMGIKFSVMRENGILNFKNFIEGNEFIQTGYSFRPYPPNTYFSEDKKFMMSVITHYQEAKYYEYQKIKKMDLEEYLIYLEKIYEKTPSEEYSKREMMKDYLSSYITKFPVRKGYNFLSVVLPSEDDSFVYSGMYLFGILPEYFVKIY